MDSNFLSDINIVKLYRYNVFKDYLNVLNLLIRSNVIVKLNFHMSLIFNFSRGKNGGFCVV